MFSRCTMRKIDNQKHAADHQAQPMEIFSKNGEKEADANFTR